MREEPSYYAILHAPVRYDKRLTANEKLLYAEITALTNKHGYCYASNGYFARLYDVQIRSIQRWMNTLEKCGYIVRNVVYVEGTKEVAKRYITLPNDMRPHDGNDAGCGVSNDMYNNTSNNNTSNNSSSNSVQRNWTY